MKKVVIILISLIFIVPASGQLKLEPVDPQDIGRPASAWPCYFGAIHYSIAGEPGVSYVPLDPGQFKSWAVYLTPYPDPEEIGNWVCDFIPGDPPGSENVKIADLYVGAEHFDVLIDYGYYTRVINSPGGRGEGEWLFDVGEPLPPDPVMVGEVWARPGYEYLGLSGTAADMGFAYGEPVDFERANVWLDMDDYFAAVSEQCYIEGVFGWPVEPGTNVEALLPGTEVSVEFEQITAAGHVIWDHISGPELPSGFQLGESGVFYDITTTAEFSGWVDIGIGYNPDRFTVPEDMLQLLHYEGRSWIDCTTSIDTPNDIIYGRVTSLSPFAIVEAVDVIPAPGAILLGSIGIGCVSWLRRRRIL